MRAERAVYDHAAYAAVDSIATAFDLDAVTLASSPALPHILAEALRLMPEARLVERLRTSGSLAGAVDPYAVVVSRLRSVTRHTAALAVPRPLASPSAAPSAEPRALLPAGNGVDQVTVGCVFCGRRPVEWHHLTGRRAPDGPYLDRSLVVPLDKRHHDREHELLRRAGLEFPPEGADLVGHRVARLLDFLGRCAECRARFVIEPDTPYGNSVAAVHALLYEAAIPLASFRREAAS